jgi:hypothetical protein
MTTLSKPQQHLLQAALNVKRIVEARGKGESHGIYVQGNTYRTAEALESKGYGTLRYMGPYQRTTRGWFESNGTEA